MLKVKTDIEIAQEANMLPISEIAEKYGILENELEYYGRYLLMRLRDVKQNRMVSWFWLPQSVQLRQERENPQLLSVWDRR